MFGGLWKFLGSLAPKAPPQFAPMRTVIQSVQPTSLSLIKFSVKKSTVCFPSGSVHNDFPSESCVFITNKIQYIVIRLKRTTQIVASSTW